MRKEIVKDTAWLYYCVKGFVPQDIHEWDEKTLCEVHDAYVRRIWHNEENYQHADGFEKEWAEVEESYRTSTPYAPI